MCAMTSVWVELSREAPLISRISSATSRSAFSAGEPAARCGIRHYFKTNIRSCSRYRNCTGFFSDGKNDKIKLGLKSGQQTKRRKSSLGPISGEVPTPPPLPSLVCSLSLFPCPRTRWHIAFPTAFVRLAGRFPPPPLVR